MGGCQIQEWVATFKFIPRIDGHGNDAPSETTIDDYDAYHQEEDPNCDDSETSIDQSQSVLVGIEDDLLIPTQRDIEQLYYRGKATWETFVREAESLPSEYPFPFPSVFGNPYILLGDVPRLPENVPNVRFLSGQPVWHVPDPENGQSQKSTPRNKKQPAPFDLQNPYGVRKNLQLRAMQPVACRTTTQQPFSTTTALTRPASGLLILTLCWSYILSARLLQMQGRTMTYHTRHMLKPDTAPRSSRRRGQKKEKEKGPAVVVIRLVGDEVPGDLVYWLCGLLAPELAWGPADGKGVPPWAAYCPGDATFRIQADDSSLQETSQQHSPPSAARATELLIIFCRLFNLGPAISHELDDMGPPTAAFLAALMLPFASANGLCPQFAVPQLRKSPTQGCRARSDASVLAARLRQYTADLPYFMTLSLDDMGIGSLLWSVFWQPDVVCNLVSVWFSATLAVLRPIILDDARRNALRLVQVFALRRPRPAMWWLGLFCLLGDMTAVVLDWIPRYMDELYERPGFGTLNAPDPTAAVWTQTPHSYLDDVVIAPRPCPDPTTPVALDDLLRHRYNFRLQETVSLAWRPFGYARRERIEPELWPWLEQGCSRKYITWVWWIKSNATRTTAGVRQSGFMTNNTRRNVPNVPDRLGLVAADKAGEETTVLPAFKPLASRMMTYWMLCRAKEQMGGDYDSLVIDVQGHRWSRW